MDTIETRNERRRLRGFVLDIDNTLAATSRFFFCALAERFGLPEGESVESLHERYHYSWRVPHWQREEVRAWDNAQEYSADFHLRMTPIAEAQVGVMLLADTAPISAYVTTRPEALREVTRAWLSRHGFPYAPLVMRPDAISPKGGNQWKVGQVHSFFADSLGIVDDHQDIARGLSDIGYEGKIFHYGVSEPTVESPKVTPCKDWGEVVRECKICVLV